MVLKRHRRNDETGEEVWMYTHQDSRMWVVRQSLAQPDWRVYGTTREALYRTPNFHTALDVAEDLLRSHVTNSL